MLGLVPSLSPPVRGISALPEVENFSYDKVMASGAGTRSKKSSTKQVDDRADQVQVEADDSSSRQKGKDEEKIHEDHLCPICQLLLFRPVTTICNHTLCESCTFYPPHH